MRGQDKRDRMMQYVREKYPSDTFEFKNVSGGHLGSNVSKIYISSEKVPNKEIRVICTEVDGEEIYKDTYLNYKYEEQTREHILVALTKEFGDNIYFKYVPDDMACTKNGSDDTTFEEYIAEESSGIYFSLAVCCNDIEKDDVQKRLNSILSDVAYSADIYFLTEGNMIAGEQGKENALKLIEKKEYKVRIYIRKPAKDSSLEIIEWLEGV